MAKVKYSALVSEMSGKLNGSVLAKNRSGSYIRTKITPVNPQTVAQTAVRNRLSAMSQAWKGLTENQRSAWNSSVEDWQKTNIFGDTVKPSGQNLFVGVNANVLNAGGSQLTNPPVKVGVTALTSLSFAFDTVAGTADLTFAPTPVPANTVLVVEATAPMSAGKSYMKNMFRQVQVVAPAGTSPEDIFAAYTTKFGSVLPGQKIGVRAKFINRTTGEVSLALSTVAIAQ